MRKRRVTLTEMKKHFPKDVTDELLREQFIGLAFDRYPSSDKVIQNINIIASRASIHDPLQLLKFKIIIINIFRDSVHQVSLERVFTSVQHRDDVLKAIIEASETLEEEFEELEEELLSEEEWEDDLFEYDEDEEDEEDDEDAWVT